jgi:hypothetical protein
MVRQFIHLSEELCTVPVAWSYSLLVAHFTLWSDLSARDSPIADSRMHVIT